AGRSSPRTGRPNAGMVIFLTSRRRHTRWPRDWSSDVCSSDLSRSGAFDGTPITFCLAPANAPEREVAREMLERVPLAGHTVIADKGFAGAEFERWMADRGATFLRPDRRDEEPRFGSLGRVRQWIESVFWTCKGPL